MKIWENELYQQDIKYVAGLPFPWEMLKNKKILISGARGMIGSLLTDVIMYRNEYFYENCDVTALGRSESMAKERFEYCWDFDHFSFISQDINIPLQDIGEIDYIIHLASNTHPIAFATDPIGTVTTNTIGTYQLLNYAAAHKIEKFLFASTVEIYGENRGDTDEFDESYFGYIDCNTLRAGYPESKRAGEALCQAFIKVYGIDVVISRIPRTYGPTMLPSDSTAVSQFIQKGVSRENVVLKSEGTQYYSYSYVADTVAGILTILFKGECGEVYNIADPGSNITLKDLTEIIATEVSKDVVFELPDQTEADGYSKATKAVLNPHKLQRLGWKAKYDLNSGLKKTIAILSELD